jgi:hypothetical protein
MWDANSDIFINSAPPRPLKGADTKKILIPFQKKLTDKHHQSPTKSSSAFVRNLPKSTFHFTHFSTSLAVSQNLKVVASLNMTHHTMIARAQALGFFPFYLFSYI